LAAPRLTEGLDTVRPLKAESIADAGGARHTPSVWANSAIHAVQQSVRGLEESAATNLALPNGIVNRREAVHADGPPPRPTLEASTEPIYQPSRNLCCPFAFREESLSEGGIAHKDIGDSVRETGFAEQRARFGKGTVPQSEIRSVTIARDGSVKVSRMPQKRANDSGQG
jgi:hypothetical protein